MNKNTLVSVIFVLLVLCVGITLRFFFVPKQQPFDEMELPSFDGIQVVMGNIPARIVATVEDSADAHKSITLAFEEIIRIDRMMSDYDPNSLLSEVNRDAFAGPVAITDELLEVLAAGIEYSKLSGGDFDVTIGPVVDLWKRAAKEGKQPTVEELDEAKSKVGYDKLMLDEQNKTVRFTVEGMRIDLGAIAKGYAIDRAMVIMKQNHALGGMIDIGGDILCFGKHYKGGNVWRVGLQNPTDMDTILLKIELSDMAIATSGDYRRFALIEEEKVSHIMDPQTSSSAKEFSSVSVLARTAMAADALATTVSVMDSEGGLELIESIDGVEAILIPSDDPTKQIRTEGIADYITQ